MSLEFLNNIHITYYYGSLIHCTSDWYGYNVVMPCSKFYYITDGECEIEIDSVKYHGTPGSMFYIPAGKKHSFYHINDDFLTKYWFHFVIDTGSMPLSEVITLPFHINVGKDKKLVSLFRKVLANDNKENLQSALRLRAGILEILSYYIEKSNVNEFLESSQLGIIISYINDHLSETLSVADLADILHLHPNYFIRYFKTHLGMSPVKYMNKLKLERAKALLENTSMPLNEIMLSLGFDESSHFSKFFKNYTGYSPRNFRDIFNKNGV